MGWYQIRIMSEMVRLKFRDLVKANTENSHRLGINLPEERYNQITSGNVEAINATLVSSLFTL